MREGRLGALWGGCRAELYRKLVEESRWSPDEDEAWLLQTLKEQLLPPEALP